MGEWFVPVTAASGALGPVLKKLTALLGDEYKLQEKTQGDILLVKSELDPVHDLLGKLWGREDLDLACKDWMTEARELSYDMEDGIDSFTLGFDIKGNGRFIQRGATDSPFKEFMERVKDVSKRCKMQKIGDTICNRSKLTTDPRALFLHRDASELVGMEEKKKELISLLKKREMVCIVGPGGMGKTTLADLVYQTIGDEFQCRAFVSVHPNPNMMDVLGTILSQVTDGAISSGTEPAAEQNIVNDISIFLSKKRYLVIIDDIWHWGQWEVIGKALPKNHLGCKIIMTTRINTVAEKCKTEGGAHVYTQNFNILEAIMLSDMTLINKSVQRDILDDMARGLSTDIIVHMSGVMPLAVNCLSSAWVERPAQGVFGKWDTWVRNVLDGFLGITPLKPLVRSLCLGFDDLPVDLRTCLLYCSMYPRGYKIERHCMVRKWFAEGFVWQQEVAEAYFDQLISRNLLQPEGENTYTVHPMMLEFLLCKAKEDNFVACRHYNRPAGSSSHAKKIRRLSLYCMDQCPDEDLNHTRSLVICCQPHLHGVPLEKFTNLRVLEINSKGVHDGHLEKICGLILLRYLGLMGAPITTLPREIGRLRYLEVLDVSGTKVTELPTEITKLELLNCLDISFTGVRELPKEIRKLQHLSTLDVRGSKVRELYWEFPNSLSVPVGDKISSRVVKLPQAVSADWVISPSGSGAERREDLRIFLLMSNSGWSSKVSSVAMLNVAGRHMKVPQWVKQHNVRFLDIRLCKLGEGNIRFLQQMPNLQALALRLEVVLPREPFAIAGGGFPELETFFVDCRLPRVVTFKPGAMPKLQHLEFKFYNGSTSQDYSMGIKHLPSLEVVVFRCSEYYTNETPGIRGTIEVVRKEAAEHPNEITLCINDMDPVVFSRGANGINLEVKAIVEKEFGEWKNETENRKREIEETAKRICKQRYLLSMAVERRVVWEKNRVAIEKEILDRFAFIEHSDTSQEEPSEWEKETRKMGIKERVGRAHDQSLRLLTEAERPAERKKNDAEIKKEIEDTIRILEKSCAENMKKSSLKKTTTEGCGRRKVGGDGMI